MVIFVRIVYMGNRQIGFDILQFLKRNGQEIIWSTLVGSPLSSNTLLVELQPDIGVSIMYPHVIPASTIALFPRGIINMHPALLPYCRGRYPALWAIIEHKPAGATLHYIDAGVDTGDIIAQRYIRYRDTDTCRVVYERCICAGYWVFLDAWDSIISGTCRRVPQPHHKATFHRAKEIPHIEKWTDMTVKAIQNEWGGGELRQ